MQGAIITKSNGHTKDNVLNSVKNVLYYFVNVFLNVILSILVVISFLIVINFVDNKINELRGNNVPPLFGTYVIITPSMVPTIKVQDAIIVTRINPKNLNVGDIITFRSTDARYAGYTITHRIQKITTNEEGERMFITKGDNNALSDSSPVLESNICGKVLLKIPKLGKFQKFLYKPLGFFLIIVLPLFIIGFFNIKRVNKIDNEEQTINDEKNWLESIEIIDYQEDVNSIKNSKQDSDDIEII